MSSHTRIEHKDGLWIAYVGTQAVMTFATLERAADFLEGVQIPQLYPYQSKVEQAIGWLGRRYLLAQPVNRVRAGASAYYATR